MEDLNPKKMIYAGSGGLGGGKGGGGGAGTPSEATDNLNSTAFASIIDVIAEGEIEGFATPSKLGLTRDTDAYNKAALKDVFFDKTSIVKKEANINNLQAGDYSFKNVTFSPRYGTQAQSYLPGFPSISREVGVGITIRKNTPHTVTITDSEVDAVRVTITIPALQEFEDDGDIRGASVRLKIYVNYDGGGFQLVKSNTIKGRTGDSYQRDYRVELTGAFPVQVKVERVTDDSDSSRLANDLQWTSYTEIIDAKLRYPNTAYVGLRVDAEQFNNIPQRSYRIRGLKIQIPSNCTVDNATGRLIYNGVWDGTFQSAKWCTCPAWALYNLLTNSRYGFGNYIQAANLDKFAFYTASKYCNELVPDGLNGQEARFSINCAIQSQQDAYKLINDMASVFRAMPFWAAGALTVTQDAPKDASYLFTLANVGEAGFEYSGASLKTRHTVAIIKYFDLDAMDVAYEVVEDQDGIAKYGSVTAEIDAFACTSRGQARRIGEWLIYTEAKENITVSFTASIDAGVVCRPGQVIKIADPVRSGSRRAGRINSATTTEITVDNTAATDLTITSGGNLSVILPDGSVETKEIASIDGAVITLQSAYSVAPNVNSIWMLEDLSVEATTWRVISVQEQDGAQYSITAIAHEPSKYNYIERDVPLTTRSISNLNVPPAAPTNLQGEEVFYVVGSRVLTKLVVTWAPVKGISNYRIRYRDENSNWIEDQATAPSYDILEILPLTYQVEVYAISPSQIISSDAATLNYVAQGASAKPADVTGASLTPSSESQAIIQWDPATDLDVLVGGKVLIHHDPRTNNLATWLTSNPIVQAASGTQTQKAVPLLEGTYFLKFEDQGGARSVNAAQVVATLPTPQPRTVIKTWAEQSLASPFSGSSSGMFYDGLYQALVLDYTTSLDAGASNSTYSPLVVTEGGASSTNYDALDILDGGVSDTNYASLDTLDGSTAIGPLYVDGGVSNTDYTSLDIYDGSDAAGAGFQIGVMQSGEYIFKDTLDLGGVYDLNLRRYIVSTPIGFGTTIDEILTTIDELPDFDGEVQDVTAGTIYVRATNDNPTGTPTWGSWNEIANGIVRGRGFQLKLVATSNSPYTLIGVTELGATAELQQRTEQSGTLTTAASTYTVTFANAFYSAPSISITPTNLATGDFFTLANISSTGFDVTFKNSAGTAQVRTFSYAASGYGRKI